VLILTRKLGEKIVIDGEITVTVLEIARGGQVRLGIDAPRKHRILRFELIEEVGAENRGAAIRPGTVPDLGPILGSLPAIPAPAPDPS
jgi:carbon storage regulator